MTMFELLVTTEFHGVNKNLTDQMMQKHVPRYQKWTLTCWGHLCAHCYTITGPPPAYNYGARLHITMFELFVTTEFHGVSKNLTDQRMHKTCSKISRMNPYMLGQSLCTLLYNHGATSCIQLWRPLAYAADVEGEEDGNVNMFAEFLPPSPSTSPLSTSSSGPWCCIQLWVCTGPYKRTALDAHNVRGRNLNSNKSCRNIKNTEYGGTEN